MECLTLRSGKWRISISLRKSLRPTILGKLTVTWFELSEVLFFHVRRYSLLLIEVHCKCWCNSRCSNMMHRGYYMAARRYEISLRVLKNILRVSAVNEWNFFQHEKRNFVSPSSHVMFFLLYEHQWNIKSFHFNSFLVWKARFIM